MAHKEVHKIDGKECPSVTQVIGVLDKSKFLVPWASKHGTKKLIKAVESVSKIVDRNEMELRHHLLTAIPDEWFESNKLKREEFWLGCNELLTTAQDKGTDFHELLEKHLRGEKVELTDEVKAVIKWMEFNNVKVEFIEKHVESKKHLYHGTYDLRAIVNKARSVVDWKSGFISDNYVIQASAYGQAEEEMTGDICTDGYIVRPERLKTVADVDSVELGKYGTTYKWKGSNVVTRERHYIDLKRYFPLFASLRGLYDFVSKKGEWA